MSRFIHLGKNTYIAINHITRITVKEVNGACQLKLDLNRFSGTVFDYCREIL